MITLVMGTGGRCVLFLFWCGALPCEEGERGDDTFALLLQTCMYAFRFASTMGSSFWLRARLPNQRTPPTTPAADPATKPTH